MFILLYISSIKVNTLRINSYVMKIYVIHYVIVINIYGIQKIDYWINHYDNFGLLSLIMFLYNIYYKYNIIKGLKVLLQQLCKHMVYSIDK